MMYRIHRGLAVLALACLFAVPTFAQDEPEPVVDQWVSSYEVAINMLQSTYSNNWNGGDKGSINWTGSFDGQAQKQYGTSRNWRNTFHLAYGQTHNQERSDGGELYWKKPDKTEDLIDFESLMRWTKAGGWDPFVAFNFRSMFDDRSDAANRSNTLNPLVFQPSAGISRTFVDHEHRKFSGRLGLAYGLNSRKFFVDPAPSTAVQREWSNELSAEAVFEYEVGALDKRVDWASRLAFRIPFLYSGKSVFEDEFNPVDYGLPEDVANYTTTLDVDWENTFTANITKVISVKLFVRWVYDKYDNTVSPVVEEGVLLNDVDVQQAIRKAGQFKQTLALGFGYKF